MAYIHNPKTHGTEARRFGLPIEFQASLGNSVTLCLKRKKTVIYIYMM